MNDTTMPRLSHGFRLQWEPVQDCHVLLYPEGMVKLNRSAGEILARCNATMSLVALVAELEAVFSAQGLRPEVEKFLEIAATQRWVVLADIAVPAQITGATP
jgi:pyrroloquinoline quinone biosynthesis protein D